MATDVLRARMVTSLRAERVFGVDAVLAAREAPTVPQQGVQAEVADEVPVADHVLDAEVVDKAPADDVPTLDLFGQPVTPARVDELLPPFDEPPPLRALRIALLTAMDDTEVKGCTRCDLSRTRTHTVFGEGDAQAGVMFIGEGPGENEDLSGRPFVGKAGVKLEEMLTAMGLRREDVYIANIVKCRPPGNRAPLAGEVAACGSYLARQIEWIRPRVIVPLGLPATHYLLGGRQPMGMMRGRWHMYRGIRVMPTYHPAYLLRAYTESNRRAVWSDLQLVMNELGLKRRRAD